MFLPKIFIQNHFNKETERCKLICFLSIFNLKKVKYFLYTQVYTGKFLTYLANPIKSSWLVFM